jgi:hypothetical protein
MDKSEKTNGVFEARRPSGGEYSQHQSLGFTQDAHEWAFYVSRLRDNGSDSSSVFLLSLKLGLLFEQAGLHVDNIQSVSQ